MTTRLEMPTKHRQVCELARDGWTNKDIAAHLHMDRHDVGRIRRDNKLPTAPKQPLTIEQKWQQRTREIPGGHLQWTGEHTTAGAPVMQYGNTKHGAARLAYRFLHGADPHGYAKATCDYPHCVAPAHLKDTGANRPARETRVRYESPEAKLAALTQQTEDGHLWWTGPMDGKHPLLKHQGVRWPVLTMTFRARYGREPVGPVRASCDFEGCVLGDHLDDTVARRAHRAAYAALGL